MVEKQAPITLPLVWAILLPAAMLRWNLGSFTPPKLTLLAASVTQTPPERCRGVAASPKPRARLARLHGGAQVKGENPPSLGK